jgi:hypothetical protein
MAEVKEKTIETHLVWRVELMGGKAYKFTSPSQRGVADRVVCLPDGSTWFVELKTAKGKLSPLQVQFAATMTRLNQNYAVFRSTEEIDQWAKGLA